MATPRSYQCLGVVEQEPSLCGQCCPCRPHEVSLAAHHVLLCRCLVAVYHQGQPHEDRFFATLSHKKNTNNSTSPLAIQSCNQHSSSFTWAALRYLMQGSTNKLIADSQRQIVPLVNCTKAFGISKNQLNMTKIWVCSPWYIPLSSTYC